MMTFDLSSPEAPKFWRSETGGELDMAVRRYLICPNQMSGRDIDLVRMYFSQWIKSPVWDQNPEHDVESLVELARLRALIRTARTVADLLAWQEQALDAGIDPL
jgi:hypothetical protein